MKKIIIVNDNLHIGGIQKALTSMLAEIRSEYSITLLLLNKNGVLLTEVPKEVQVISPNPMVRVLGANKPELSSKPLAYIWKGFLLVMAKLLSKKAAFQTAALFQPKLRGYDIAISYSHPSMAHDLRSCSAEFVLEKIDAKEKICFVHSDYQHKENHCDYTNKLYEAFDKVACCSNSVKEHFLNILPAMAGKTYAVCNFYDTSILNEKSKKPFSYDSQYTNLLSVARLTAEKGIKRAVEALAMSQRKDIRYYIIGEGAERTALENTIDYYGLEDQVFLLGEKKDPYVYMRNADYLLVPSYYEAAPIVFDEAKLLGIGIIATETTSAKEKVSKEDGIVCGNSMDAIMNALQSISKRERTRKTYNNSLQIKQLFELLDGNV